MKKKGEEALALIIAAYFVGLGAGLGLMSKGLLGALTVIAFFPMVYLGVQCRRFD